MKRALRHLGDNEHEHKHEIDLRTWSLRFRHPDVAMQARTTQVWKWSTGEAIVVVVNKIDDEDTRAAVVIREGDCVEVVRASGLNDAMHAVGLDFDDFTLVDDGEFVLTDGRTLDEVAAKLRAALPELMDDCESAIHRFLGERTDCWPTGNRWVACYAVRGGSEGWWVHVDAVWPETWADGGPQPGKRKLLLTAKTFKGREHAQAIASECARLLDA